MNTILYKSFDKFVTDNDIKKYTNLTELYISGCDQLTDDIFGANFKDLEILDMSGCFKITDKAFEHITDLSISKNNKLTDEMIMNLKELKVYNISNYIRKIISDETFENLGELNDFNINFDKISISGKIYRNLKKLSISGCTQLSDDIFKNLRNLTELNISGCTQLSGNIFKELKHLTKLHMSGCNQINDESFKYLGNLTELNIDRCKYLSDKIFNYLPELTKLSMRECSQSSITNNAFDNLKKLQILDMFECDKNVTLNKMQWVNKIDIQYEKNTTNNYMFMGLKKLKKLNIGGCGQFDKNIIRSFYPEDYTIIIE